MALSNCLVSRGPSWENFDRMYVLFSFSFEKCLSPDATLVIVM